MNRKRFLFGKIVAILCLLLIFSIVMTMWAVDTVVKAEGSAENPFQISTAEQLKQIAVEVDSGNVDGYSGSHFVLTQDIDLSAVCAEQSEGWEPIGDYVCRFKGTFDGNGYTIKNLNITRPNENYVGLFGILDSGATVKNLTVSGTVTGKNNTGAIAGQNYGRIENCTNAAMVTYTQGDMAMNIGGIAGYNEGTIENCANLGGLSGNLYFAGGIAGSNYGSVVGCLNDASVTTTTRYAGGIAGTNGENGHIEECFNSGAISAKNNAGGIAGNNESGIANVYNIGTIKSTDYAGGISGENAGTISNAYVRTSTITGKTHKGAIVGQNSGTISAAFNAKDLYPNGKDCVNVIDLELSDPNVLQEGGAMAALNSGAGAGKWTKRGYDENSWYLPELSVFSNSVEETAAVLSKTSAAADRVVIEPSELTLAIVSYTYDGTAHEPGVLLSETSLTEELDYNVTFSDNVNAGTATAAIELINYYKGTCEKIFTIAKKEIEITWSDDTFTFDGQAQHPTATVSSGVLEGQTVTFTYDNANNVNAGEYTVTAVLPDTAINNNYTIKNSDRTYKIGKAEITIGGKGELIYNGSAQVCEIEVLSGRVGQDEITFTMSDYGSNIASGRHTATAALTETATNANYKIKEAVVAYEIKKKPVTLIWSTELLSYNGKAQCPTATVSGAVQGEKSELVYSGYESNISVGSGYIVYAELAETDVNANYLMERQQHTYSIGEKVLSVVFSDEILVFNGHAQRPEFTVNGLIAGDKAEWLLSDFSGNIHASTGGAYTLTVSLKQGSGYKFEPVTITYDIAPMPITVAWKGPVLVYNGQIQRPEAEVAEQTPTALGLRYADYNGRDAGSGYGITIIADSPNYMVTNTLTYDILPKKISAVWTGKTFIYDGTAQYPKIEFAGVETGDDLNINYEREDSVRAEKYVISVNVNNPNYSFSDAAFTYEIMPKKVTIEGMTAESRRYDGTNKVTLKGGFLTGTLSGDDVRYIIKSASSSGANAGTHLVKTNIVLSGKETDCYTLVQPTVYLTVEKAIFAASSVRFEDRTFAYDGQPKSLFINYKFPDYISVTYSGNGMTEVGSYTVTARFTDSSGNYEPIPDKTAVLYISKSRFTDSDNAVHVEVAEGALPYETELKIEKQTEWDGEYGKKKALGVYDISLYNEGAQIQPNGKLKITLTLEDEMLNNKNFVLLHVKTDGTEELPFTVEGNKVIFYTDSLSEFVLLSDKPSYILWYILGACAFALIVTVSVLLLVKKRKASAVFAAEYAEEPVCEICVEESIAALPELEIPFTLDGVSCASKASFLAALCFKNAYKQREVAAMPADKAKAHAVGKGGDKRTDLYWQDKRIKRGSNEYLALIERAEKSITQLPY